jgi:transcription elongation GreA/GreB family factor
MLGERVPPSSKLRLSHIPRRDLRSGGTLLLTHTGPPPRHQPPSVRIGSTVRVRDADGDEEYTIVSSAEADPWHGRISSESPVGRALLQARHGEEVSVRTPGGMRVLTIIEVTTPPS